jgi:tripeptide aminopeptidase
VWLLASLIHTAVVPASGQTPPDHEKALARIAAADPVLATALELIRIPSPSGKEDRIARHILKKLREAGADARRDPYGNVVARIPASPGYEHVPPLLLGAHMDMVPADKKNPLRAVRPRVKVLNGTEWIATDGTTTLGADDKAGVAVILDVVRRLTGTHPAQSTPLKHGPIEVALTREEETTVQGAKALQTTGIQSRYALLLDGTALFEVVWELAGATEVTVRAHSGRGGHSGVDIHRPDNVNAIKVLSEIDVRIPQGVVKRNERGVVTSINAGLIEGGQAKNAIAPAAQITYLLRTTDTAEEKRLISRIRAIAAEVEQKYRRLQKKFRIEVKVTPVLPPWAANTSSPLVKLLQETGKRLGGQKISPLSIHAGAEANIYANKKNSQGEILQPLLLGVANLHAIHTTRERIDWRSLMKGRDWIIDTIRLLAEKGNL